MSSSKMVECRICHDEDLDSTMETPCSCRGTLKYAHRRCVQRWCHAKGDTVCEICHQPFKPDYKAPPRIHCYGTLRRSAFYQRRRPDSVAISVERRWRPFFISISVELEMEAILVSISVELEMETKLVSNSVQLEMETIFGLHLQFDGDGNTAG
ncbi:E3 ubiquitin-protein ligase MARCH8-like [Ipomoea triloba]|uniref:E3 ubiquitin-protein ligase MARCH8-like n=1 Tax=Ipomoea triloba TaxID=35885 RepID=UPI00125D067F|nr:E3 ubiquitin-protein ligase MARCH8-like [Ipomoea triloba]